MNIYLIKDDSIAIEVAQLVKLNSECAKLHWSRKVKNIPTDVKQSLEIIESFVEKRVSDYCSNALFGELNEEDENCLMLAIGEKEELRNSIGTGVVMAGSQATKVKKLIGDMNVPKLIMDALETDSNIILF